MAILIVEDNPTNAMIIKHLAKKVTVEEIKVAGDGNTALMLCHAENFEMLIVDHLLPGMSGLRLAREIKALHPTLKVAIASGYINDELRLGAPGAGVEPMQLRIALDTGHHRHFMWALSQTLALYSLGAILVSGVLGWWAARRAMATRPWRRCLPNMAWPWCTGF